MKQKNISKKIKTGNYTFDFGTQFNDLLNQENGSNILNNSFQLAINSFAYDHPEIFYIDITKMYLLTETTTRTFSKTHKVGAPQPLYTRVDDERLNALKEFLSVPFEI